MAHSYEAIWIKTCFALFGLDRSGYHLKPVYYGLQTEAPSKRILAKTDFTAEPAEHSQVLITLINIAEEFLST